MANANALQWNGSPGHYEVYYLTVTDPATGIGLWIRYTMRAPLEGDAECHLWFLAMTPAGERVARKLTLPASAMHADAEPFRFAVGDAVLTDTAMTGAFEDVSWDLTLTRRIGLHEHVDPVLRRLGIAKTILTLPQAEIGVSGTVRFGDTTLTLDGAAGGQAHLWGSKHAARWAWAHANAFTGPGGEPRADTFVDGVSVIVPRFGREIGPSTPVVGRFGGQDFAATSPLSVTRAPSSFALTTWRFEATDGKRRIIGEVDAPRETLVGVTYHDPDGDEVYCYNSEVADMRLTVWDRTSRGRDGWTLADTLLASGTAHFEYAQRTKVDGTELLLT